MQVMRRKAARVWIAAAGAVLLHALLLAVALAFMRARPIRSMRVSLVRTRAPVASPLAPTLPLQAVPPRAVPSAPAPKRGSTSPAPAVPTAPSGAVSAKAVRAGLAPEGAAPTSPAGLAQPRGAEAASSAEARSREWLAREGLSRLPSQLTSPLLLHLDPAGGGAPPPGAAASAEAPGPQLVREKSPAERLAEEKATVSRKVEGWASDTRARGRAQSGRDVYWQSVEDALRRGFDPGWDLLQEGPQEAARSRMGAVLDAWQKSAAAYGKSGSPFGNDPDAPGAPRPLQDELATLGNADRGLGSVSLGGGLAPISLSPSASAAGKLWSHQLVALVRITQREDGSLFGVELLGTSGSPAYDRLALEQARKLSALKLGPPKQGRETLWAFETDFTQVPPLPIAGCALDDFIPKDCFYPLQKRVRSRVRLQAIY
jgi:hypothetical protein